MTQVPSDVLQDTFGHFGVELVTRDLSGEEGGCKQRSLGTMWAVSVLPGGQGGRLGSEHETELGVKLRGSHRSPGRPWKGQPRAGGQAGSALRAGVRRSPGRLVNRPPRAVPGHTASSQSGGRATGGPWSSGGSPVPGQTWGWRLTPATVPTPLPPAALSKECLGAPPPHLPHVVSDTPVGHHLQGMQGHLLGPRTVLG